MRVCLLVLTISSATQTTRVLADGAEQVLLDAFELKDVYSTPDSPSPVRYMAQAARDGVIDLTATNGFFDRCFEARDQRPGLASDDRLINNRFGYLTGRNTEAGGIARWHLWCSQPGKIEAQFFFHVPPDEAGHTWTIRIGDDVRKMSANKSDASGPQKQSLTFEIKKPGKVTFTVDCSKQLPPANTRLHFIRLTGSATEKASLLRTRWRPSAVHARYSAPESCNDPDMWVFETQAVSTESSYSPLTTPFGYFGTSLVSGRVPEAAGFNFSMWITGRNATEVPPIAHLPQLIGTALRDADYSSFGHEGTGIKFRNAVAYPRGANRIIQAMRVTISNGLTTYYGYFYDEDAGRWKLYASAIKPSKQLIREPESADSLDHITLTSTGSFCEIPGPPNRQRSGDVVREIKRRGWFHGSDGRWYRAQFPANTRTNRKLEQTITQIKRGERVMLDARRVYYMDDYLTAGWMGMATGGIECYSPEFPGITTPGPRPKGDTEVEIPEYLTKEKTAQLFKLPVDFGSSKIIDVTATDATIEYDISKTGPDSKAILYYGVFDALTYTPKPDQRGSVVQKQLFSVDRTWQHATPQRHVSQGINRFTLRRLKPSTTYHYRLFVTHDEGQSWDYRSWSFRTR